jgi:type I restriction enzyme, R subunit
LDLCTAVYEENLDEDEQIDFKAKAKMFIRTYQFLAQILPFVDTYMESLKTFLKFLLPKLPAPADPDYVKGLLESVDVDSYRVEQEATVHIMLEGDEEIDPVPTTVRSGRYVPELDLLSRIIADFNNRFGNTSWGGDDKITRDIFEDLAQEVANSEEYQHAKANSDRQNAKIAFEKMLVQAMQKYIFTRTDFYRDFTNEPEVKSFLVNELFRYDYDGAQLRKKMEETEETAELPPMIAPITLAEIIACLKRVRKSIELWRKEGGRRGYYDFVSPFLP